MRCGPSACMHACACWSYGTRIMYSACCGSIYCGAASPRHTTSARATVWSCKRAARPAMLCARLPTWNVCALIGWLLALPAEVLVGLDGLCVSPVPGLVVLGVASSPLDEMMSARFGRALALAAPSAEGREELLLQYMAQVHARDTCACSMGEGSPGMPCTNSSGPGLTHPR